MRWVRGTLAVGWLVLVVSLFHDPVTPWLTRPDNDSSPFRLSGHTVVVQGTPLVQASYPMGRRVFWTMVFPCVPLFLMVFGHEAWRRICPLSFFSQIPRMLGRRPRWRRFSRTSGQVEERLRLVKPDSWLRTNFWYVQFGLLWLGVSTRLVATNGSAPALGTFILLVVAAAITVGYFFGGKTWCNYICPVSVVQRIYTGPHGLFESQAHLQKHPVTQSMCRVSTASGAQSNCVGCVSPCPDIDLERSYWQTLDQPGRRFAYYGYVGLIIGFYGYYFLYAGNWDYYYSGAWTHEAGILSAATLFGPGFYVWGTAVPVPKIVAAPLTIAVSIVAAYGLGCMLERLYGWTLARHGLPVDRRVVLHRSFSITTFLAINLFYLFAGRPNIRLLPEFVQSALNASIVTLSTLWLVRSLARSPSRYQRESVVNALLKQLKKFTTDFSRFLDGRSLDDLGPDEVYLLAKTAPGVSQEQKQGVYKDVLQESIATGRTNSSQSLAMLAELRLQVGVTDDQHHAILQELGVEDPSLLDPLVRKEQEDQLRLDNYGTALQALTMRAVERGIGPDALAESPEFSAELHTLRSVYQISSAEQARAQKKIAGSGAGWHHHTALLLREIGRLSASLHSLRHLEPDLADPLCRILSRGVNEQRQRHAATLLRIAASVEHDTAVLHFSRALHGLLGEEAQDLTRSTLWKRAVESNPSVESAVSEALAGRASTASAAPDPSLATFSFRDAVAAAPELPLVYATLAGDVDPIMSGTAIAALARQDPAKAEQLLRARIGEFDEVPWFLQEAAASRVPPPGPMALAPVPPSGYQVVAATTMAKLGWLTDIDLFDKMPLGSLADLARHGELRRYAQGATICQEGQRADCMFLLLSGDADVFIGRDGGMVRVSRVATGQTVGEMGVFTKKPRAATVVIASDTADLLEFSEEHLDEVWENPHASRGVLLKVFEYYQQARSQVPPPTASRPQ